MTITRELRLFAPGAPSERLLARFSGEPEKRVDYYVPATADFGLKARSGRFEVKVRRCHADVVDDDFSWRLETWEKRRARDAALADLVASGPSVSVSKTRWQRPLESGAHAYCELTRLEVAVDGAALEPWWTVSVEAVAPPETHCALDPSLCAGARRLLAGVSLAAAVSQGYAAWVAALARAA